MQEGGKAILSNHCSQISMCMLYGLVLDIAVHTLADGLRRAVLNDLHIVMPAINNSDECISQHGVCAFAVQWARKGVG